MRTLPSRLPRPRAPKVGRPLGRFTQHRRLDRLIEALEGAPRGLTLEELAIVLRVTQRSVRRYLRELDGTTDLESIETTPGGAHLWRIKPSERGRAVTLRRAQAYALLATRRALETLKGSALYDEVHIAFGHIEQIAKTPFRSSGKTNISGEQNLESRFFWLPPTTRTYTARGEDLDELFRAVADLRLLRFRPRTRAGETRAERVVFQPYAMVVHDGAIVVLGVRAPGASSSGASPGAASVASPKDEDVEVVTFETMTEIRASETEHFELPAAFDVTQFVHGEFGIGRPTKARAIIEFEARMAEEVRAKKLHRDQKLASGPDGRVRLSLPLVGLDKLVAWILSHGDGARVIEPPELAMQVADILARAAARYR